MDFGFGFVGFAFRHVAGVLPMASFGVRDLNGLERAAISRARLYYRVWQFDMATGCDCVEVFCGCESISKHSGILFTNFCCGVVGNSPIPV
jgi:hypothetical protein